MELHQLKRIIEAALLASAHPLSVPQISGLFDELAMPAHDDIAKALAELKDDSAERGVELVEVASGFRYQVRQDVHAFVSRLWNERQTRYSRALLETLSLIAYRQPITRGEIEQIRGVAVSTNIVRTLEEREWVRVVGYRDLPGKPALFGTTKQFLDYFNLKSLDELPPLSEIREIEELEPQLAFDPVTGAIPAVIALDADTDALESNEAEDDAIEADAIETIDVDHELSPPTDPSDVAVAVAVTDDDAALVLPSLPVESPAGDDEEETPESVA